MQGKQISEYRLLHEIGRGGMGYVYLAEHVTLPRRYAVKALHPQLTIDPSFRERFFDEARNMSVLNNKKTEKINLFYLNDAIPGLPFGHLNAAWKKFFEGVEPEDCLWAFAAIRNGWGRNIKRLGYAVVRGDKIVSHFPTMCKRIEELQKKEDAGVSGRE